MYNIFCFAPGVKDENKKIKIKSYLRARDTRTGLYMYIIHVHYTCALYIYEFHNKGSAAGCLGISVSACVYLLSKRRFLDVQLDPVGSSNSSSRYRPPHIVYMCIIIHVH